jgi:uncharacterized membrane protein YqjE
MIIKGYTLILMGMQFHFLVTAQTDEEFKVAAIATMPLLPLYGRIFGLW